MVVAILYRMKQMKRILLSTAVALSLMGTAATAFGNERRDSDGRNESQYEDRRDGDRGNQVEDRGRDKGPKKDDGKNGDRSKDDSDDHNGDDSGDRNGGKSKDNSKDWNGDNSNDDSKDWNGDKSKDHSDDENTCRGDCGNGGESEEPETEVPVKPTPTPKTPDSDGPDRSEDPVEAQHWTGTCERMPDGRILVHTAFLRNQEIAHRQCKERIEALEKAN